MTTVILPWADLEKSLPETIAKYGDVSCGDTVGTSDDLGDMLELFNSRGELDCILESISMDLEDYSAKRALSDLEQNVFTYDESSEDRYAKASSLLELAIVAPLAGIEDRAELSVSNLNITDEGITMELNDIGR